MSRVKATRTPTIPPAKPTSRNEKGITCGTLSEALVFFAISGMNNAVSVWYARPKSPESRDGDCIPASPALWVVRPVPRTVFYFIQSAMTGFTACVFPYPNRVSPNEAFEVLEPDDGKLSRPVLRGPGPSNGVRLLDAHVLCCLLRPSLTEAPSLRRSYPASSVVRTSPPPQTARPVSRELPVDPYHDHRWGFPCCVWSPMRTCHRHYPGRFHGACSLVYLHRLRPSLLKSQVGSCNCFFGACSAFTHVMACTLAESLNDPLHRKLRQLRCLRCRFGCYRVERTSSRAGVAPAEVQRLSRRTLSPTTVGDGNVAGGRFVILRTWRRVIKGRERGRRGLVQEVAYDRACDRTKH